MAIKRRDIDRIYNALRPRLNPQARSGAVVSAGSSIPAHTHSADQIGDNPVGDVAAENVQDAIAEIASEKLARDGSQTVTGDLDHDHHSLVNVHDADLEGTATVGEDIAMTGGAGSANITGVRDLSLAGSAVGEGVVDGPRVVAMQGAEADGEARVTGVNGVDWNEVTVATPAVGRSAWDAVEDTLVVYVASGAAVVLVAVGWAVKLAANGLYVE